MITNYAAGTNVHEIAAGVLSHQHADRAPGCA